MTGKNKGDTEADRKFIKIFGYEIPYIIGIGPFFSAILLG